MSVNKVILIGNIGQAPEIKTATADNIKVAKLSLATEDGTKDKPHTNWHTIKCWSKLAEIVEKYIKKGNLVYVEGYLNYTQYTDKSGATRYSYEIMAQVIRSLEKKPEGPSKELVDAMKEGIQKQHSAVEQPATKEQSIKPESADDSQYNLPF